MKSILELFSVTSAHSFYFSRFFNSSALLILLIEIFSWKEYFSTFSWIFSQLAFNILINLFLQQSAINSDESYAFQRERKRGLIKIWNRKKNRMEKRFPAKKSSTKKNVALICFAKCRKDKKCLSNQEFIRESFRSLESLLQNEWMNKVENEEIKKIWRLTILSFFCSNCLFLGSKRKSKN